MLRQAKTVWKCSKSTSKFCTSKRHSISTGATRRKTKIWNSMHFLTLPSCSENRDSTACKLPMKFKIWTSFVIGWIKAGMNFIFPFMGSLHAVITFNILCFVLLIHKSDIFFKHCAQLFLLKTFWSFPKFKQGFERLRVVVSYAYLVFSQPSACLNLVT